MSLSIVLGSAIPSPSNVNPIVHGLDFLKSSSYTSLASIEV